MPPARPPDPSTPIRLFGYLTKNSLACMLSTLTMSPNLNISMLCCAFLRGFGKLALNASVFFVFSVSVMVCSRFGPVVGVPMLSSAGSVSPIAAIGLSSGICSILGMTLTSGLPISGCNVYYIWYRYVYDVWYYY